MPKAFTETERQFIRARLVEAGETQFSTFGLRKTNVEELAGAAGISKAAFYLFFESKEALFMEVVERAEQRFRQEILAAVEQPGRDPRARLVATLQTAFTLWKTIPVLRFFTTPDYDQLARRVPPEVIQEHLASDRGFIIELVARCRVAGIPVRIEPEELGGLLYTLFFASLHEDDLGPGRLAAPLARLIELLAAYCLGEVSLAAEGALTGKGGPA